MKLYIDGILIDPKEYTGEDTAVIDIVNHDDNGIKIATITTEFELSGSAYDMIYAFFISDPQSKLKSKPVLIYADACCDNDILLFEGLLAGNMIEWCYDECKATVTFKENTEETQQYNCIRSTNVADNWNGFRTQNHPRIPYCIELRPDFMQFFTLSFASLINSLFLLLAPFVFLFQGIVNFLNILLVPLNALIPGTANDLVIGPETESGTADLSGYMDNFNEWVNRINTTIIGCGRQHPSPFVRSYIKNVCAKCGITFQSSILNTSQSEYYNSMYFNAPVQKGTRNPIVKYISDNAPTQALDAFLEDQKLLFNGQYTIENNVLIFERKDFFYDGTIYVNFLSLVDNNRVKGKLCYSMREDRLPALATYSYTKDAVDEVGNEALDRFNDTVEWNQPYNPLQAGKKIVDLPFGVPRFRDDFIDTDILAQYDNANFGGIGATIANNIGVMIMSKGVASAPKIMIWDGQNLNFARTKKYLVPNWNINIYFDNPTLINEAIYGTVGTFSGMGYNYYYFFNEINMAPNTAYAQNAPNISLYGRFHAIDNPKTNLVPDLGLEWTFTFYFNCASLSAAKTAKFVGLPNGTGRIKKTTVNLKEQTITLTGDI
jgi:hypothetical protein